ncbi:hypothetical protein [Caldimonas sp. KR1-144]|uniref:hypothetical protein n=1 Tax=Caldimonas sp. KR1-144 TaxID=3400911 RepID=UPI003C085827
MNLKSTLLAATMFVAAASGLALVLATPQEPAAAPLALPEPGLGALLLAGLAAAGFLAGRRGEPR